MTIDSHGLFWGETEPGPARAPKWHAAAGLVLVLLLNLTAGCNAPTPPSDASEQYDRLVQTALARGEGRPDTSFFWLSNTGDPTARTLMLELGLEYLRYDRPADVLCVWTGEGLQPAQGYVTAPTSGTVPTDSVGPLCNIEGTCTAEPATDRWMAFRCN